MVVRLLVFENYYHFANRRVERNKDSLVCLALMPLEISLLPVPIMGVF